MHAEPRPLGSSEAPSPFDPVGGGRLGGNGRRLLTADDLADRWQVPKSHVYRLTREGAIPAIRLGRYYRYKLEAIEAFEERHAVSAPAV